MKKGFTLMEVLAVLLIIAVVASMTVPLLRRVNYQVKNSQAKTAALKLAEALRSYYQTNRGYSIAPGAHFDPTDSDDLSDIVMAPASECASPVATGIPSASAGTQEVRQLFACGYLSFKDFKGIPYQFWVGSTGTSITPPTRTKGTPATDANYIPLSGGIDAVFALPVNPKAGSKFEFDPSTGVGYIYVDGTLKPKDTY